VASPGRVFQALGRGALRLADLCGLSMPLHVQTNTAEIIKYLNQLGRNRCELHAKQLVIGTC
jgi:hypothetical protein